MSQSGETRALGGTLPTQESFAAHSLNDVVCKPKVQLTAPIVGEYITARSAGALRVCLRGKGVRTMLNKTFLAGLACAIGLSAPAFGQSFPQWAPHASLGGAVGGGAILGATV